MVWRCIAVDAEPDDAPQALLIASAIVARLPYHKPGGRVVWQDCTLRQWLNGDFLSLALSDEQRCRVALSAIDNPDNPMYGTNGGPATEDHIFLLRSTKQWSTSRLMSVWCATWASRRWWWLRSPGW